MMFRPRPRLLAFAETLPTWLAVWIIERETRRAERWLAIKDARAPQYGGNGIRSIFSGSGIKAASKRAAMAQQQAFERHQAMLRDMFETARTE